MLTATASPATSPLAFRKVPSASAVRGRDDGDLELLDAAHDAKLQRPALLEPGDPHVGPDERSGRAPAVGEDDLGLLAVEVVRVREDPPLGDDEAAAIAGALDRALVVGGDRWSLRLVETLLRGPHRFGKLQAALPDLRAGPRAR